MKLTSRCGIQYILRYYLLVTYLQVVKGLLRWVLPGQTSGALDPFTHDKAVWDGYHRTKVNLGRYYHPWSDFGSMG